MLNVAGFPNNRFEPLAACGNRKWALGKRRAPDRNRWRDRIASIGSSAAEMKTDFLDQRRLAKLRVDPGDEFILEKRELVQPRGACDSNPEHTLGQTIGNGAIGNSLADDGWPVRGDPVLTEFTSRSMSVEELADELRGAKEARRSAPSFSSTCQCR